MSCVCLWVVSGKVCKVCSSCVLGLLKCPGHTLIRVAVRPMGTNDVGKVGGGNDMMIYKKSDNK